MINSSLPYDTYSALGADVRAKLDAVSNHMDDCVADSYGINDRPLEKAMEVVDQMAVEIDELRRRVAELEASLDSGDMCRDCGYYYQECVCGVGGGE